MAWMRQHEAAVFLEVSPRTLARRIREGQLETKRTGRCVLVDVPDAETPTARMADSAQRMAEVSSAAAIQRKADTDALSATLSAMSVARAEAVTDARRARRTAMAAIVACVAVLAALAYGARAYHLEVTDRTASDAKFTMIVGTLQGDLTTTRDQVKAAETRAGTAESQVSETKAGILQARTQARTITAERDRLVEQLDDLECTYHAEVSQLTEHAAGEQGRADALTLQLQGLQEQLRQAGSRAAAAERYADRVATELDQTRTTARDVTAERNRLAENAAGQHGRADTLAGQVQDLRGDLAVSQNRALAAETKIGAAEFRILEAEAIARQARTEARMAESQRDALAEEVEDLRCYLAEEEDRLATAGP